MGIKDFMSTKLEKTFFSMYFRIAYSSEGPVAFSFE